MATALPDREDTPQHRVPTPPARGGLLLQLGRILLAAAEDHPPPWPERDPAEDLEEPAIVRKARRQRRREASA